MRFGLSKMEITWHIERESQRLTETSGMRVSLILWRSCWPSQPRRSHHSESSKGIGDGGCAAPNTTAFAVVPKARPALDVDVVLAFMPLESLDEEPCPDSGRSNPISMLVQNCYFKRQISCSTRCTRLAIDRLPIPSSYSRESLASSP